MNTPNYCDVLARKTTKTWIKTNYNEFYNFILESYPQELSWGEKLYWYYNNINTHPKCICGKELAFLDPHKGYRKYCSPKCAWTTNEYKNNIREAIIKKYGVDNVFKNKDVQQKQKTTLLKKYGVENVAKIDSVLELRKNTLLKKYGVENSGLLNSRDIINNSTISDIYTYGCPHRECTKCVEKVYECDRNLHNSRKAFGQELCTKLMPKVKCNNKNTTLEIFVKLLLDEYNIKYIENDRTILSGKELDIYIPDKKIAIECNGIYWHSAKKIEKERHRNKYIDCLNKGIQLITIWEDQIKNHPSQIHNIILSKLGIYNKRLYARKCVVKEINAELCRMFTNKYHLQGYTNSSIRIGLFYDDELVSIMTFGKGRKCLNSSNEWELYRYCCKEGFQIVGGASKLFKYFIKKYQPTQIVSFSSNDISTGDIYKNLGFEYLGSSISYWYIEKNSMKRYHRFSFTKSKLVSLGFDSLKSESEIMEENGYIKIYDSGQTKFIYNK